MRILLAVLSILLGLAGLVAGIGQRTFWAPPETATASLSTSLEDAPLTVIEPSVDDIHDEPVDVEISGEGEFTVALGRSADVEAWVGDAAHNTITGVNAENGTLFAEHTDGGQSVPNPAGSDLWVATETADGSLTHQWTEPADGDWSLLVAKDGKAAAPTDITVSWPNDAGTPFALPLVIAGALLVVLGLALLLLGRRGGGTGAAAADRPADATQPIQRPTPARMAAAGLAAAALALAPAGAATAAPESGSAASGSASPSGQPGGQSAPPILIEPQMDRILESVSRAVATGDEAKDADKLRARVAGHALAMRKTNYAQRADGVEVPAPAAVPSAVRSTAVPAATGWPRTFIAVTQENEKELPQALVLRQEKPRSNYRLVSSMSILPGPGFPGIAVGDTSVRRLPDDAQGLVSTPRQAVAQLAAYLDDPSHQAKSRFAESVFIEQTHAAQKEVLEAEGSSDADIEFKRSVDDDSLVALSTPDGGALVYAYISSSMTIEPKEAGGTVGFADEQADKLAGGGTTTGSAKSTYAEPVLLRVPPKGSGEKISLAAGESVLQSASHGD